ncbi:PorT family protein [Flavihumibacter rivuli]|uniref:outer membrane beta-barrel protein n=1 Tax=Flavihumibacter rivuli TaxID=2838156 RepID=UPI001BDE5D86|nr:outer membrane beta-barrel protein [Flavihumibacter rivuli]ULQ56176.1 PorT family protein [Flavihumibacter rivuli]
MLKKTTLLALVCFAATIGRAQTDTTQVTPPAGDTMRIGNIIILKNGGPNRGSDINVNIYKKGSQKSSNVTTNWLLFDFGFNNYVDNTNYGSAAAQAFAPGSNENWFNLRNSKSVNVNIWFFMQRLNLINHVVNLKYGLGLELYNFRYEENIRFTKNPPSVYKDEEIQYSKNKLATDYVTVPLMLNFNFTPNKPNDRSFGLSVGVSGSYLYSSRQKYVSDETGKDKTKGNLGLNDWKLAYIGEVQLGPVKLYGSYATRSMFKDGLDQTPYAVGLRIGNW